MLMNPWRQTSPTTSWAVALKMRRRVAFAPNVPSSRSPPSPPSTSRKWATRGSTGRGRMSVLGPINSAGLPSRVAISFVEAGKRPARSKSNAAPVTLAVVRLTVGVSPFEVLTSDSIMVTSNAVASAHSPL